MQVSEKVGGAGENRMQCGSWRSSTQRSRWPNSRHNSKARRSFSYSGRQQFAIFVPPRVATQRSLLAKKKRKVVITPGIRN